MPSSAAARRLRLAACGLRTSTCPSNPTSRIPQSTSGDRGRGLEATIAIAAALCLLPACGARVRPTHAELAVAANRADALALSDALEALIAQGHDTPLDREYAYQMVRKQRQDTAASHFARAAIIGRWVQLHGLRGATLVEEVEREARRSRELDPHFRDGAATRLLGTLYVIAPAVMLKHGNSEEGLEILEGLVDERPDVLENHLRLAEAYVTLGDPAPAYPHLCRCLREKDRLRPDDRQLLEQLITTAGVLPCDRYGASPPE
jgi:hypothetical protein